MLAQRFPGIDQFLSRCIRDALEQGYVTTLFGRRRAIPEIQGASRTVRNLGERLAINSVIQGSGSKLTSAETLEGNFVLYDWSGTTHKLLGSTYGSGGPTLFAGQMIPGLETALIGQPHDGGPEKLHGPGRRLEDARALHEVVHPER